MEGGVANYLVTVVVAMVGGGGGYGTLQLFTGRTGRKAESGRIVAETEKLREESKKLRTDREALIADVQREAYAAAKQTYEERYQFISDDYGKCRDGLNELRLATESVIDAFDVIISKAQPVNGDEVTITVTRAEIAGVRATMRSARSHLN